MPSLLHHDQHSLRTALAAHGIPPTHATKLLRTYYQSNGHPILTTPPFPKSLITWYATQPDRPATPLHTHRSADGTQKLLLQFPDKATVESVLIPTHRPSDVAGCLSSQVGCAMACDFCASTKSGLQRNLLPEEITDQFLHLKTLAEEQGKRLKTIVFMGIGEPLHNLDNVLAAIHRIAHPDEGGLGWRQITVSTVGIPPGIDRLAAADLNVHLAVSLHAPDDPTRAKIIPTAKRYSVEEILAATDRFYAQTHRVPTIEYTLLSNVNDSDDQAYLLARLLHGRRFHVNLIPYNPIGPGLSGTLYTRPSAERMTRFLEILRDHNVVTHFRQTKGDDVSAACGQLRQLTPPSTRTSPTTTPAPLSS